MTALVVTLAFFAGVATWKTQTNNLARRSAPGKIPPKPGAQLVSTSSESLPASSATPPPAKRVVKKLSKREDDLIEAKLASLQSRLSELERARFSVVYEKDFPDRTMTAAVITEPSVAEFDTVYDEFFRGSVGGESNPELDEVFRARAHRLVASFRDYPKPFKVLIVYAAHKSTASTFIELFADDPKSKLPNEDGYWKIVPEEDFYSMDERWGQPDSWAGKRYSHLFALDVIEGQSTGASHSE